MRLVAQDLTQLLLASQYLLVETPSLLLMSLTCGGCFTMCCYWLIVEIKTLITLIGKGPHVLLEKYTPHFLWFYEPRKKSCRLPWFKISTSLVQHSFLGDFSHSSRFSPPNLRFQASRWGLRAASIRAAAEGGVDAWEMYS